MIEALMYLYFLVVAFIKESTDYHIIAAIYLLAANINSIYEIFKKKRKDDE